MNESLKRLIPSFAKRWLRPGNAAPPMLPSIPHLEGLMKNYRVDRLVGIDAAAFKRGIEEFLGLQDHAMEGYGGPQKQRDLSVKFYWGHDHDFGGFRLKGLMGGRHLFLLAYFIDEFRALPKNLEGKSVLDIGCWTGGTSLLAAAMGARVVAVEEVKKYVDCLRYLKNAFDLKNLEPVHASLYECTADSFQDAFDYVLFAGVLYHLTDPVLALRIAFNALKDGGALLLETTAYPSKEKILSYDGPTVVRGGSQKDLSRHGWNWFHLSPPALVQMMKDVGFAETAVKPYAAGRMFAVGKRKRHEDMLRAGLSARHIR